MASLHYITHAVTLAVIATLVRKYLQMKYAHEDLEERCLHHPREERPEHPGDEPYSFINQQTNKVNHASKAISSELAVDVSTSIWCSGQNRSNRMCKFENLCYNTLRDDFVFLQGDGSVIEGVDPLSIHSELLDMSSVKEHNLHFLRMVDLPSKALHGFTVHWIREPSLLFNRFKPDNIMHVLHDDIIPLHYTLEMTTFGTKSSKAPYNVQIVFFEGWDIGEFESIYSHFATYDLKTKEQLKSLGEMVCFSQGQIGISKTPTWYQYGFDQPQSPLNQSDARSKHIHRTVHFLLNSSSHAQCEVCKTGEYLVLLSRKENRLILNELELTIAVAQETNMKVVVISFETHSVSEMMDIVHKSRGVIGMHGSLMILSAFLKPGSVVIELFPFAINPNNYTPFKSLAAIPGMNLVYKSWANQDRDNTVMHPDWPTELGGIHDMSNEEQSDIVNQPEVPLHLCCEDPSWLFHIYQDTKVDIPTVIHLLKQSLSEGSIVKQDLKKPLLQGPVKHVTCDVSTSNKVTLSWDPPWNVKYLNHVTTEFEIWLQNTQNEATLSLIVGNVSSHVITDHVTSGRTYNVWIRCVLDQQRQGPFSDAIQCHLDEI